MALPTITADNFTGFIKIVANEFKSVDVEAYIETFREHYLRRMVGASAYTAIASETRRKWDDLLNGVDFTDVDGDVQHLEGLKNSLLYFIYFEFVRDNFTNTQGGQVGLLSENSEPETKTNVLDVSRSRFNKGVSGLCNVPDFLEAFEELTQTITSSTDDGGGLYTLLIPYTKYLEAGDAVTIEGVSFDVASVVENTSLVIDAGEVGLDFTAKSLSWKPFDKVNFCPVKLCGI